MTTSNIRLWCRILQSNVSLSFLMFLAWMTAVHSQTLDICEPIDTCACRFSNGSVIDIAPVGKKSGGPRFGYAPARDDNTYLLYAANVCYGFNDHECKNQVICQLNVTSAHNPLYVPLGHHSEAIWESDGNGITYEEYYEGITRTSHLTLECDTTGEISNSVFIRQGIRNATFLEYDFILRSICACPDGCRRSNSAGLSFGSILCITFTVSVVIYLVVGMLFMKFVKGADGIEIIPNGQLWTSLPGYVKDGTLFVTSCGKPAKGSDLEYESI